MNTDVPKRLWLLWYQGLDQAPFLIKCCIERWQELNPDWEIVILDKNSLKSYLDDSFYPRNFDNLPLMKQSNLVRLALLMQYGGVWADATTYCQQPLSKWLNKYTISGFFAFTFENSNIGRLLDNWFLAATPQSPLIIEWYKKYFAFFDQHQFKNEILWRRISKKLICFGLNRSATTTKYWFHPFITQQLKVYPYFVCHYLFTELILSNPEAKKIWEGTPRLSADPPHNLYYYGLLRKANIIIKEEIKSCRIPLYKLTWKYDQKRYKENCTLYYLLEEHR